jgi:hypothetical protein
MTQPNNFIPVSINWDAYDVPTLWSMVEPEQDWANREQVRAWMRMHDMLVAHQENLQRIRDGLSERWPTEGSAAGRAFLGRLNTMIKSAQDASYAARSNASALNLLTDALLEARSGIEPLHRAWQSGTPEQQAGLNQQARAVMAQADGRVAEHGNQFAPPPDVPQSSFERWQPDPGKPRSSEDSQRWVVPPLEGLPSDFGASESPRVQTGGGMVDLVSNPHSSPGLALTGSPVPAAPSGLGPMALDPSRARSALDPFTRTVLPVGGVLAMPPAAGGRLPGSWAGPSGTQIAGPDPAAGEDRSRAVASVQVGERSVSGGPSMAESDQRTGGLMGSGLGGAGIPPSSTRSHRYPAEEEWDLPAGVAPVIQPAPPLDSKIAFDPGPNVIGLSR